MKFCHNLLIHTFILSPRNVKGDAVKNVHAAYIGYSQLLI